MNDIATSDNIKIALANRQGLVKPTFVVGCPRSGTTLLARIIGTHPDFCYLEEFKFFEDRVVRKALIDLLVSAARKFGNSYYAGTGKPSAESNPRRQNPLVESTIIDRLHAAIKGATGTGPITGLVEHMLAASSLSAVGDLKPSNPLRDVLALDRNVDRLVVDGFVRKYQSIIGEENRIRVMFQDFALLSGKTEVVEKTPGEDLFVPKIMDIFPQARIVHIIRDGRDVVSSMLYSKNVYGRRKRKPWRKACRRWIAAVEAARVLPLYCRKDNYVLIRYEDLIEDMQKKAGEIFHFIDTPFNDETRRIIDQIAGRKLRSRWNEDMDRRLRKNVTRYITPSLTLLGYPQRP